MRINSINNHSFKPQKSFGASRDTNTNIMINEARSLGINTSKMEKLMKEVCPNGVINTELYYDDEKTDVVKIDLTYPIGKYSLFTRNIFKNYLDYTQYFMPFESILSPNHTEALLSCTKKINKKKEELLKKYKDKLDAGDVAAAEDMEKELLVYAEELLKGDPSLDVYFSGAGSNWKNNFKNMCYILSRSKC